jgi:uncharacterized protein (DUF2235 family)
MKRLIFCFDGTWNRLSADTPTNVVLTAASIVREASHGVTQIIHYDEGVGTARMEKLSGGIYGAGLEQKVREAYRFLIFNYDPGDQIFVFGFSRGAFSAQTFVGFLRHVGPLHRLHAARIEEALDLYQRRLDGAPGSSDELRRFRSDFANKVCIDEDDEVWRCENVDEYEPGSAQLLKIAYLGVWDTVGALGFPAIIPFSKRLNRKHAYHDTQLTDFVERARHAVAIDERRALFPPTLWGDLSALNRSKGFEPDSPDAPYQERWFPGVHGSVGGGGDIRDLSDQALNWVLKGAKQAGLELDTARGTRIHGFKPNPYGPIDNRKNPTWGFTQIINTDRDGPEDLGQVSVTTRRRWHAPSEVLPNGAPYRPRPLERVAASIEALPLEDFVPREAEILTEHVVEPGDTLRKLANHYYKDSDLSDHIFHANKDVLDNADDLFVGGTLRIPKPPSTLSNL